MKLLDEQLSQAIFQLVSIKFAVTGTFMLLLDILLVLLAVHLVVNTLVAGRMFEAEVHEILWQVW